MTQIQTARRIAGRFGRAVSPGGIRVRSGLLFLAISLVCAAAPGAQVRPPIRLTVGTGQIALIDRAGPDTLRYPRPGDTITVDIVMNWGRGESLAGVQFYLRFDPAFLAPLDAYPDSSGLQPVRSEGLIPGSAILADEYNPDNPARYRGISYAEGTLSSRSTPDSGRVAWAAFRMLKPIPPGGDLRLSVERDTVLFRSYYLIRSLPGIALPLTPRNELHLTALPPVLSLPTSLYARRDSVLILDLDPLAADPLFHKSQLTWAVTFRDTGFAANVDTQSRKIILTPPKGFEGATTVTLTVTNPGGISVQGQVLLQVIPANRSPSISPLFPAEIRVTDGRSDPVDLNLLVADPEVAPFALRWTFTGQRVVSPAVDPQLLLRITAPRAWQGRESVTMTVTDPEGASVSLTFAVVGAMSPLPGDFDGNGRADLEDFFAFAEAYGAQAGGPGFDAKYDMDRNGRVELDDFFLFAAVFGGVR